MLHDSLRVSILITLLMFCFFRLLELSEIDGNRHRVFFLLYSLLISFVLVVTNEWDFRKSNDSKSVCFFQIHLESDIRVIGRLIFLLFQKEYIISVKLIA